MTPRIRWEYVTAPAFGVLARSAANASPSSRAMIVKLRECLTSSRPRSLKISSPAAVPGLLVELLEMIDVQDHERQRWPNRVWRLTSSSIAEHEVAPVVELGRDVLRTTGPRAAHCGRQPPPGKPARESPFVVGIERHDRAGVVEGVQELEHADVGAGEVLHRHRQHRARRVLAGRVEAPVQRARLVHADRVGVLDVDDLTGLGDVTGQAGLGQP
jgi:hypothetical protein